MGRLHRWLAIWVVSVGLGAGIASAQEVDPGAEFARGVAAFDAGDFETALAAFEASHRARPVPLVLFNIGATQLQLGRLAAAERTFRRILVEEDSMTPERRAEVMAVIEEMGTRLGRLTVIVEPRGAEVRVDGEPVGIAPLSGAIPLDPGEHRLEVIAEDHVFEPITITVSAGLVQTLTLRARPEQPRVLEPVRAAGPSRPSRASRSRRAPDEGGGVLSSPIFWIAAGVVVAGAGAATWYVARDDREPQVFAVEAPFGME